MAGDVTAAPDGDVAPEAHDRTFDGAGDVHGAAGDDGSLYGRAGGDDTRPRRYAVRQGETADLLAFRELLERLADVGGAARLRREGGGEQRSQEYEGGAERRAHLSLAATKPSPASEVPEWFRPPSQGIRGRGG